MAVSTPLPTTLDEWLSQVQAGHPVEIELGLERIGLVGQRLGLTPGDTRILTVAGTNGKGSCVAAVEAALGAAGLRVGCYTSPHLQHYSERVRVEGQPLDEATLCEGFARVQAARGEVPLTFFEFGTLAALVNLDRKSTRLNSSHVAISYAVFCLKKTKTVFIYLIVKGFRLNLSIITNFTYYSLLTLYIHQPV